MKTKLGAWLFLLPLILAACSQEPVQTVPYDELEWQQDVYLWKNEPFSGVAVALHEDGSKKGEYPFVEGRFDGVVREFWPNGQQSVETHFEKGQRHGSNRYWNEAGQLTKEQIYEHDRSVSVKKYEVKAEDSKGQPHGAVR
ncbi:MAG: hypothetical protein KDK99_16805 [Verrucomicrobiales bacterium]|nr:hypothetical protein [Verrucomicrobiales bacterium]